MCCACSLAHGYTPHYANLPENPSTLTFLPSEFCRKRPTACRRKNRGQDQSSSRRRSSGRMLASRRIHTIVDAPRLTKFLLQAPKCVAVEYANGSVFNLSAEFLRIQSPAADGKIRSIGGEKVISGRRHVGIMSAEPVGNYGVRIIFDDLHKTGIYSWDYFYHLGSNKYSLMRNYIKTLRKYGLSRDPPKRK